MIKDEQFDISYYYCKTCEFMQMDDSKRVPFDKEREVYDRHENSIECEGYVNMFQNFINSAVIPFKSSGLALDFGSGPEPVLTQIIKRDYEFDIDNYDLHFQPEKVYEGKKYDVIVSTEVVEHLPDPMEVFRLFHDLLEDGGVLAFMTLFHENDDDAFLKWWYRRDETHISFFTVKTLENIAKSIGFKVIYTDGRRICTFRKQGR